MTAAVPPGPPGSSEQPWQRLDKRMLLVHPVNEVVRFVPVLIGTVILGASSGNHAWSLVPALIVVGLALTRWFTTTYRVGPTHVELRTGLIQRRRLAVPRSRIRSVDIEADLLHRVLGLAVLAIGTGQQAEARDRFRLDSLDARLVPALRGELLAHTRQDDGPRPETVADDAAPAPERPPGREIGHWRPGWVRYAPLSLTGFAIVAPIAGFGLQYGLGERVFRSAAHGVGSGGALLAVAAGVGLFALVALVVSAAACGQYLATYYGLRVLDDGRTLHLRHGLFTTRQITLDLARFRGATVKEPLLLRLAGAAELEAIMTGENPRQRILPQAPRGAVHHTLAHLLTPAARRAGALIPGAPATFAGGAPEAPVAAEPQAAAHAPASARLRRHGRAARTRRYTRTMWPAAATALIPLTAGLLGAGFSPLWWLLPPVALLAAAALAEDRYRGLGHAVLPATGAAPTWLITRAGSLDRARDCVAAPGVIGWTVRQSWWQRRAGLATVVAATAAGRERYLVPDVPVERAWEIVELVTPGLAGARPSGASRAAR